jgi:hypothetical protein
LTSPIVSCSIRNPSSEAMPPVFSGGARRAPVGGGGHALRRTAYPAGAPDGPRSAGADVPLLLPRRRGAEVEDRERGRHHHGRRAGGWIRGGERCRVLLRPGDGVLRTGGPAVLVPRCGEPPWYGRVRQAEEG